MKKILGMIVVGMLLFGCSAKTVSEEEFQDVYKNALMITQGLKNYSITDSMSYIDGSSTKANVSDTIYIDETDGKQEIQILTVINHTGQGETEPIEIKLWYKAGYVYLSESGTYQKSIAEYKVIKDLHLNSVFYNSSVLPEAQGSIRYSKNSDKQVYKFKLDEDYARKLFFQADIGTVAKICTGTMEVTLVKGIISETKLSINIQDSSTNNSIKVDVTRSLSDIGITKVEFPSNLDAFLDSSPQEIDSTKGGKDSIQILKQNLVDVLGYKVDDDNNQVYSYDWETEAYIFDFAEMGFILITEEGSYAYSWETGVATAMRSGCTNNLNTLVNKGCSDEEIENLKLTKEIFNQELQMSGLSEQDLKD